MKSYHLTEMQTLDLSIKVGIQSATVHGLSKIASTEQLQALVNAALDQVLGEQWQPIETVPVNKSVLMLRLGKHGRCGIADGYKKENGVLVWPYINKEPTHWMPLPNAPRRAGDMTVKEQAHDIELPPLPPPFKTAVYATSANTKSVRDGVEVGGYVKEPPLFVDAQMHEYALAAVEADRKRRGVPVATVSINKQEEYAEDLDYGTRI